VNKERFYCVPNEESKGCALFQNMELYPVWNSQFALVRALSMTVSVEAVLLHFSLEGCYRNAPTEKFKGGSKSNFEGDNRICSQCSSSTVSRT